MEKKTRSIANDLKRHLIFIVLAVSFVVIYTNHYLLNENFNKIYNTNKNRILKQIKLSYIYPIWKLDENNIALISNGYMQNDIICSMKIVSLPYKKIVFKKGKERCEDTEIKRIFVVLKHKKIGYIDVTFSKKNYNTHIKDMLITNISLVLFIISLIYFSIELLLKNKLERPIEQMLGAIQKIKKGEYREFHLPILFEEFKDIYENVRSLALKIEERETQLRQSEEKFRNLAENAPLGILIYQGEHFVYSNNAVEEISGYSKNELLSMKFWSIVAPEYQEMVKQRGLLRQRGVKDLPDKYEFEIITKRGGRRLLYFIVSYIEFNERPAGLIIVQDITEQRKNQLEVERLRNLLQNIINSMPSILITVDKDFRVVYWNRFLEKKVTETSDIDIKNKYIFDILSYDRVLLEKMKDALNSKDVQFYFRKSLKQDGSEKYENITIFPLQSNGMDGAVVKIEDITEQMKFEEMLIHSEKMITIGNMAAGIAHEINNPLAIIMQACDVCFKRLEYSEKNIQVASSMEINFNDVITYITDRKIDRMLFNIKDATKRCAEIIRSLLEFSQSSSGKKENVDIRKLMDNTIVMACSDYDLKKKYDIRKIKFVKKYTDIPLIKCDPVKIQQVFLNVIKNAAQAMVGIENPEIKVNIATFKNTVKIQIQDNGFGIPKSVIGRIFDPFYTTKQVGEGVGLGLYISYFIITRQHNGKIVVDSDGEKGTTFTIYLPINIKELPEYKKNALLG